MTLLYPTPTPGVANLSPRDMIDRNYVGDHLTLLHTKYVTSGPHGFRQEDFCRVFSYVALHKKMTPWGVVSLNPRGLIGRNYVGVH